MFSSLSRVLWNKTRRPLTPWRTPFSPPLSRSTSFTLVSSGRWSRGWLCGEPHFTFKLHPRSYLKASECSLDLVQFIRIFYFYFYFFFEKVATQAATISVAPKILACAFLWVCAVWCALMMLCFIGHTNSPTWRLWCINTVKLLQFAGVYRRLSDARTSHESLKW